jgi:patatin-like phospholipase/acyl hydrolase
VKYFRTRYDYKALVHELREAFGDRLFGESETRLVIPAFLGPKSEIAVLKTDHHPDFKRDYEMPAWEVARATSAAPAFFQAHDVVGDEDEPGMFLDGGVWANSPIMAALVDTLSAYDVSRDDIRILSIGTGEEPFEISRWQARGGFLQWAEIIKAAIFLTTDNAQSQAGLLIGPQRITRLNPETWGVEMDDWRRAVEVLPPAANKDFEEGSPKIQSFFESTRPVRERFYCTVPQSTKFDLGADLGD